jgi:hypothetical protein
MRELIAFDGAVECRVETGAVTVMLRGFERSGAAPGSRTAAQAMIAGSSATEPMRALPARLHEVHLFELAAAPGARRLLLSAREIQLELACRSLQVHRDVGRVFFGAVPPPRVSLKRRLGWTVLLLILRIPGAGRLLAQLRGSR